MHGLIREIVSTLDDVAGLDRIWRRGLVHRGGPHYRLRGTLVPISLGEDECAALGRLIEEFRPGNCFAIGNAFGMSSVFIAKMMERHGGKSVVTLDSKTEGDGERCFHTAQKLRERMDARLLANKVGWSPQDVDCAADDGSYDLIFIDGDHSHPQATLDFEGVKHLARQNTILCWHDYWLTGVQRSIDAALQAGYQCVKINTSCEMTFGTKDQAVFRRLARLFPDGEAPRKRRRILLWGTLCRSFLGFVITRWLLRRK